MKKKLIKKLAEETIYSAKGHFKSCDLRRTLITFTIWICTVLSVLALIIEESSINKWITVITLLGSIGLLIWNEGEGKNYRERHKKIGEQYLSVHKELRDLFFIETIDPEKLKSLSDKVKKIDKSNKPDIPYFARKWAQSAIKKHNETDNWFE